MREEVKFTKSRRGEGPCGNPYCESGLDRAPDRFVCEVCMPEYDRIREELREDPRLLFHQRSDNPDRKTRSVPTCKTVGCFQERVPPDIYCDDCNREREAA